MARKPTKARRREQHAGGDWGESLISRLRLLAPEERRGAAGFAGLIDVDPARVSDWFSGKQLPRAETLHAIALKTGVSLDWLFFGTGPDGTPAEAPAKRGAYRNRPQLEEDLAVEVSSYLTAQGHGVAAKLDTSGTNILATLRRIAVDKIAEWEKAERLALATEFARHGYITTATAQLEILVPARKQKKYERAVLLANYIATAVEEGLARADQFEMDTDAWFSLSRPDALAEIPSMGALRDRWNRAREEAVDWLWNHPSGDLPRADGALVWEGSRDSAGKNSMPQASRSKKLRRVTRKSPAKVATTEKPERGVKRPSSRGRNA